MSQRLSEVCQVTLTRLLSAHPARRPARPVVAQEGEDPAPEPGGVGGGGGQGQDQGGGQNEAPHRDRGQRGVRRLFCTAIRDFGVRR